MQYTEITPELVNRLKNALERADAVVIGAGAGLSTAAGFTYDGDRFKQFFSDFIRKYHFRDMYTAGFYPFPTPEEYWAFWSRCVLLDRYESPKKPVHARLWNLVQDKPHFVIDANVDRAFQRAGFAEEAVFCPQGDLGRFQCAAPCHRRTYDNEAAILAMIAEQKDMRIPSALVPRCPNCGAPMRLNLRGDEPFVEDLGWHEAASRYVDFAQKHLKDKLLLLELGADGSVRETITAPFLRVTRMNANATYASVNLNAPACPKEIADRAILITADPAEVIDALR